MILIEPFASDDFLSVSIVLQSISSAVLAFPEQEKLMDGFYIVTN